ncbi:HAD family hydrolase [Pseudobutyrivibrio xylanivorans]|uniref:HAD family hydrolase n=1 Tax=Pseudobutyrivibrio xylanivorans TaxID=185007 RepID=A0A5P6VSW8_PSEXY|nr:HAD family hydrolase [Pseudobutyrivibrio xylanivorans]QFJ53941.1 HAD family hydrolase [Pseudobutyrivibrio xylanivorans]
MAKIAIFDFDGTIVNTITDVALSFNKALETHGFPTHPMEAFDGFVGGNLETVVSRMLPKDAISDENIDKVKFTYREIYGTSPKENTKPYDGIMGLLQDLKDAGWKLAINTNKGQKLVDDLTAELFPEGMFDSVVGYLESRPSKPDPYGVKMICEECGGDISDAIYIGDGMSDVNTAINAGIPCVFVTWGQGDFDGDFDDVVSVSCVEGLRNELLG